MINEFITLYLVAAISAAIFAIYQIYLPALTQMKEKCKDPKFAEKGQTVLSHKWLGGTIFFCIAVVIFPLMIPVLLIEPVRAHFVSNFVRGALD